MLDFVKVKTRRNKDILEVYPDFLVKRSKDLMVRGGEFYAIWNAELNRWSTDIFDAQSLVDKELAAKAAEIEADGKYEPRVKWMSSFSSQSWSKFIAYAGKVGDNYHPLDSTVIFSNTKTTRASFSSKRLSYPLEPGPTPAFDELIGTLYSEVERDKIMWAIGSIIDGASKDIQKFFVFFGRPGTGKSTAMNIIQKLFEGYTATFEARSLVGSSNTFATESFRSNPLIAMDHDADLSRVTDNSRLNSIVSHDDMTINVKYLSAFTMKIHAMLFIATNKPVRMTDAKSGLMRRLVDIRPSGEKVSPARYDLLVSRIQFELGAIAHTCYTRFKTLGKDYYAHYKPIDMMFRTNVFYNFVEEYYHEFRSSEYVTLSRAWRLYKQYCKDSNIEYPLQKYKMRDELKEYFNEFYEVTRIDGSQVRSVYKGFDVSAFEPAENTAKERGVPAVSWLVFEKQPSILDSLWKNQPAQYGSPFKKWAENTTTLSDIKTTRIHYVQPPEQHIVIDFDIKDSSGDKNLAANIEAARRWPPTYAELSKSGSGIHLHYYYEGDVSKLSRIYEQGIEVLAAVGDFSVRRKLRKCNHLSIATINSGLPLKGEKMQQPSTIKSERSLRALIMRNLNKEIHASTAPSVSFIEAILAQAYDSGLAYDVSDMKPMILQFASGSTHQAKKCIAQALNMKYASELDAEPKHEEGAVDIIIFDVEVFPNLFLINWKRRGPEHKMVRMINPTAEEVSALLEGDLVGFNNRSYDNHILYAASLGFNNEQLYQLSKKIIQGKDRDAMFGAAYGISYADIYDYAAKRQSLKKWELELGIEHKEFEHPWDEPVPPELVHVASEYCDNDVYATEAVFDHTIADFYARKVLAELSGLSVNSSNLSHSTQIIFEGKKNPQADFNYVDLSKDFPGYKFENGVSTYRGEVVGEGGYVYSEPGMYNNVAYLDVASMHPASIEALNYFGPHTKRFNEIKAARLALKNKNYPAVKTALGGSLAKYVGDPETEKNLQHALKIVINKVYGYTCAHFPNAFLHRDNKDNIIAKRGALFMVDLRHALKERGISAVHFKTDSVKVPNYTKEIVDFIVDFGKQYGYDFGCDGIYEKLTLINKAVLIGKWSNDDPKHKGGTWSATGAQFAHPYVFKTLFSKEPIRFEDFVEKKAVRVGKMYLHYEEDGRDDLVFIGRVGAFCPVLPGTGGARLVRVSNGKEYAVTETKGFLWKEADVVRDIAGQDTIDMSYFTRLVDKAVSAVSKYGDFEQFIS